jgi:predicted SprT family Zn-dependent metalloprotease
MKGKDLMRVLLMKHRYPEWVVRYCVRLKRHYPFEFVQENSRFSKLGDFTYRTRTQPYVITLNKDLNKDQFLITLVHEIAHRVTAEKFGRRVQPHGNEWKRQFQRLMRPLLKNEVFRPSVLKPLEKHLENPKSTTFADPILIKALNSRMQKGHFFLSDIGIGRAFSFNGRYFKKLRTQRTNVLCREIGTRSNYLVPATAIVQRVRARLR